MENFSTSIVITNDIDLDIVLVARGPSKPRVVLGGFVADESGRLPVEGATVELVDAESGTVIASARADRIGRWSLEVGAGSRVRLRFSWGDVSVETSLNTTSSTGVNGGITLPLSVPPSASILDYIGELEKEVKEKLRRLEEAERLIAELEDRLKELRAEKSRIEEERDSLLIQVEELSGRVEEAEGRIAELEEDVTRLSEEVERLRGLTGPVLTFGNLMIPAWQPALLAAFALGFAAGFIAWRSVARGRTLRKNREEGG